MSKKFPVEKLEHLRSAERLKRMPPAKIFDHLDLFNNIKIADIGCGVGTYTIPIADHIKKYQGIIWAIDVEPVMIEETKKLAESRGLQNIQYFISSEGDFKLPEKFDIILLMSVLHEFPDLSEYLNIIWDNLNPGGYLVIIDMNLKKSPDEHGPPDEERIPLEKAIGIFNKYSNEIKYINDFYPNYYLLKVKKAK
jgi:2-polyprenyl-3-methyl-5-hydroxy-6-metoxy-1,4-benzoquinol methylase